MREAGCLWGSRAAILHGLDTTRLSQIGPGLTHARESTEFAINASNYRDWPRPPISTIALPVPNAPRA
ncbi:hypothetical protein AL035_02535 [Salipiger aestuarii]|uniref:hypothetical protein n=1 Tax=Salipiger aestuarii TaxID=568098 RepID=UPI000DB91890|nr:hypothetical protein [Salipiger aestuarii]KAB2543350.1 hypothetical protein AL035_02535 [Salipiger aestuarii]